jgi:hypothetical protein
MTALYKRKFSNITEEGPAPKNEEGEDATWGEIFVYMQAPISFATAIIIEYYFQNFALVIWSSYVAGPLLDFILPADSGNVAKIRQRKFEKDNRFLIPLYLTVIIDCLLYGYILYGVSIGRLGANNLDFLIYLFGAATLGAVDVSVGHELIHRTGFSKVFGRIPWFKMLNTHLYIYHVQLHHKHTGYPLKDPSIPYQYKSVYSYSNLGREPLVSTYNYEVERLASKNITSPV